MDRVGALQEEGGVGIRNSDRSKENGPAEHWLNATATNGGGNKVDNKSSGGGEVPAIARTEFIQAPGELRTDGALRIILRKGDNMERLRKIARNLGSAAGIGLALLLVLGASTRALAATDPGCTALNGDDTTGECRVSGPVTVSGVINLGETLHILAGGIITVPAAPAFLTLNITTASGDFVMDAGSLIGANVGCPNNGPNITVALSGGDIDLQTGSTIRSNGCSGGFIQITTPPPGNANIDGLVESVGSASGTGGNSQAPGGGPITITACNLTVSDTGVVSSRGADPGADLVHLEGCVVVINGRVESTGSGHAVPHNPANSCSNAATFSPRRNPVTRPGKPLESTGCVEIWSGTTVLIDSTGTHKGEVNADVGFSGGTEGRGWIDILANGSIEIRDGTGNNHNINPCGTLIPVTFAVHANGGLCQNTDDGGLILIQSSTGDVTASGDAIQADATRAGGKGGQIIVEALKNISFSGANVFARGDFDVTGGFGSGGKIGPTTPTDLSHLPLGPAPIRAFTGFLKWVTGSGDARPTGSLVPIGQRGEINLRACLAAGGVTLGASFPVNGAVVPPYPTVTNDAVCGGAPTRPAYATPFPSADCVATCEFTPGGVKEGVKFNDLNKNGILDPGEPLLDGWEIHLFGTLANGNPAPEIIVTTGPPAFLPGSYVFTNLPNGTYTVCEILKPLWTQSAPLAVPPPVGETLADCTTHTHGGTVTPGPRGYTFTVTDTNQTFSGNDFGNFVTEVCPEDLARASKLTRVVDLSNAPHGVPVHGTVQAAYGAAAATGEVIGLFGQTIENVVLDANKNVTITQCTNARVTASNSNLPVWTISAGKALIIGPDAVGGTVGWLVQSSGHELKGLRASGASEVGIQVVGNNNKVSWNSSNNNAVGVSVSGDFNDLRGGTVAFNAGVGVHLTVSANNNTLSGATIRNNGGDGIRVDGSLNTLTSDKVYSNGGDGVEINGAGNILKSVVSNTGNSGSATENGGAEFKLNTGVTNGGGNKADNTSIPSAAKCATFPNAGTVCE